MRTIILFASLFALSLPAFAGRLELVILQFPEVKSIDEVNAALARVRLEEITNSNRTMTREAALRGATVVFAQSLATAPQFASTTRMENTKSEVTGSLGGGKISVSIALSEGVQAGLRRFQQRVYTASAPLTVGPARVLSHRQISGKIHSSFRGAAQTNEISFCSVLIGQLRE